MTKPSGNNEITTTHDELIKTYIKELHISQCCFRACFFSIKVKYILSTKPLQLMMHEVEIATLFNIIIRFRRDVVLFAVSFCVTGLPTKTDSMKN